MTHVCALFAHLFAVALLAGDVPWLKEVQQPAPAGTIQPHFRPLLAPDELRSPMALAAWKRRRAEIEGAWRTFLGPMPPRPTSATFEILHTEQLAKVNRQKIRYENEPGQFIEAFLLLPRQASPAQRRAGIIALHATTPKTNGPIAGVEGRDEEQLGLKLAEQGFIVICPKNFLWEDAPSLNAAVQNFHQRHPDTLGMHKMLYDAQRATDILAALPEVDPQRLGTVGHSLGAKEVLYLTAFDNRIAAAVFSEGGIGLTSTNWDAPWYLGSAIKLEGFPRDHHELIALIAPRPFLVLGGESGPGAADGARSWPYLASAMPIYGLYGTPARVGLHNHREGHTLSAASFQRLAEWLRTYLQQEP